MKKCSRCGGTKSNSDFYKSKTSRSGLQSYYKVCTRQYKVDKGILRPQGKDKLRCNWDHCDLELRISSLERRCRNLDRDASLTWDVISKKRRCISPVTVGVIWGLSFLAWLLVSLI